MAASPDQLEGTPRQMSLLAGGESRLPDDFKGVKRTDLGREAWIDLAPNWLPGADAWFDQVTSDLKWSSASRPMYDRVVDVPRLIVSFKRSSEAVPSQLLGLASRFDDNYNRYFTSIGCNWYRDGNDSVAMHRDRIKKPSDSVIAIVSVGERRSFLLKPDDGGPTKKFSLGDGDLLVMGGATQKYWQHAVPKVSAAGPRVCMMFRS
jgi:alkylated DNA repair dioxygenase AlkB